MKSVKWLVVLALAVGLAAPVRADELARQGNVNLVLQLGDMLGTRVDHDRGAIEDNPLARPFVRSNLSVLGYAVASNVINRLLWHRAPKAIMASDALEVTVILQNAATARHLRP